MSETPYEFQFALDRPQSTHTIQFGMIPSGARVLDVGCHTGTFGSELKSRKACKVEGVESNPIAAHEARTCLEHVYELDVESSAWASEIKKHFDVVLFGDILEHTREPEHVLRESQALIAPGGKLIMSVPNIANLRVRLGLLRGNFDYQESGILDRTHLRFFTMKSARALAERAGFRVKRIEAAGYSLPAWLIRMFPTLLATQFVLECEPSG